MYTDFNILEYKKNLKEKDKEIKDSQTKIKILIHQVTEKNNQIKNLESIIKLKNNNNINKISNNSLSNNFLLYPKEAPMLNYKAHNNINNNYNLSIIVSSSIYKNLLKNYEKLKNEHEELKKENNILYTNINCLTLEKNDAHKLLEQKKKEIIKLKNDSGINKREKNLENQIKQLKEINEKLLNEIYMRENKNEPINYELKELKESNNSHADNDYKYKEELEIKIKNLEFDKKNLENKIKNLEFELNEIKNKCNSINKEEINLNNNEIIKQLNETINAKNNEIKILGQKLRENELNYLNKITKLQEIRNKIKNNYILLEEKKEITFSIINHD
jgi:hypothetical protein